MIESDSIEDYWQMVRPVRRPPEEWSTVPTKKVTSFPIECESPPNYILRANSEGVFEWIPVRGSLL